MSTGLRRRTRCQSCGQRCQVTPLELMLRGGHGWRGHWLWWQRTLCPACQTGLLDQLGTGRELLELEPGEQIALSSG